MTSVGAEDDQAVHPEPAEASVAPAATEASLDPEFALEPFDLPGLIRETADPLSEAALDKGLSMLVKTAATLPPKVAGDPTSVRQVLAALLGNAVRFTDAGEVVASVTSNETSSGRTVVRFEISDTGPGIPAEAMNGSITGGLARSRQLIELMDGRLQCSSAPGLGSTLCFDVPFDLC